MLPGLAYGAVIAAIIAGAISLANLVGGKENKTSEFRQAWIDSLRSETAKLIAHALALDGVIGSKFESRQVIWKELRDDAVGFSEAASNIRMRLNPDEAPSLRVLQLVLDLERLLAFDGGERTVQLQPPPAGAVAAKGAEISLAVAKVLKRDWGRVKLGEPVYLAVVAVSILLLFGGFVALLSGDRLGVDAKAEATKPDAIRPGQIDASVNISVKP